MSWRSWASVLKDVSSCTKPSSRATFLPHLKKVPSDRLHALIGGRRQIVEVADAMFLGLCLPKTSSAGFAVEIENRTMIEPDGDLLQTSARIYVGLLSFT